MCEGPQTLHWFPALVFGLWGLSSHCSSGFVVHIATYLPRALFCSGATAPGSPLSSTLPLPFLTIFLPLFPPQQKKDYNTTGPPPPRRHTPHSNGDPPPAFATTSTETIGFSIGFGFAALIYVSLEIFREFYIDFVDIHREIRVFTQFRLPHHAKCRPNIANSAPHPPKPLGTRSKLLWTLRVMEITFPSMEDMKTLMEVMTTPL
jgi:hypothetical protein